jgi:hypothetical protein
LWPRRAPPARDERRHHSAIPFPFSVPYSSFSVVFSAILQGDVCAEPPQAVAARRAATRADFVTSL